MITGHDLYNVLSAVVPLYVAMILAYGSVRWWGILTPDQCGGINRFVAIFAVPLLSFEIVSSNDPYSMNLRFILADGLQKLVVLVVLAAWHRWWSRSTNLDWFITLFMLATLPNTLVMGVPLLAAMYGSRPSSLVVQAVVLQCVAWYTLLLVLYEYRAATSLIRERFPGGVAAAIVSLKVDPDVVSLDGREQPIQADAEVRDDGKLRVTVRRSFSTAAAGAAAPAVPAATPRPSDLTGADIYSLHSSRNPTPRHSNFHWPPASMLASSRSPARPSIVDVYPYLYSPTPRFSNDAWAGVHHHQSPSTKDLQMFIWSASASPTSEAYRLSTGGPAPRYLQELEEYSYEQEAEAHQTQPSLTKTSSTIGLVRTPADNATALPPARVMTKLILSMVWRKLVRNPNTYSSLLGVAWALVSFKWHLELPAIVDKSITILSSAGLGMAMFSLGLFMALQKRLLACGTSLALYGMLVRFVTGPAIMAASSVAVGLRGVELKVSIVQAALPQGIVPFVFAKEYDLHPDVLSTAVIFGMLVAFPITLLYYVFLGL